MNLFKTLYENQKRHMERRHGSFSTIPDHRLVTFLIEGLGESKLFKELPFVEMETARDSFISVDNDGQNRRMNNFRVKPVPLSPELTFEDLLTGDLAEVTDKVRIGFDSIYDRLTVALHRRGRTSFESRLVVVFDDTIPELGLRPAVAFVNPVVVIGLLIPFYEMPMSKFSVMGATRVAAFMDHVTFGVSA